MDLVKLSKDITKSLPKYAQPLFLRFINEIELTGTYKVKKVTLRKEGFDISQIEDKMFYKGPKDKMYKPFTKIDYDKIMSNNSISKL